MLPGMFHRGLSTNTPAVLVPTPETGSMGGPSPHRSVVFNRPVKKAVGADATGETAKKAESGNGGADGTGAAVTLSVEATA